MALAHLYPENVTERPRMIVRISWGRENLHMLLKAQALSGQQEDRIETVLLRKNLRSIFGNYRKSLFQYCNYEAAK